MNTKNNMGALVILFVLVGGGIILPLMAETFSGEISTGDIISPVNAMQHQPQTTAKIEPLRTTAPPSFDETPRPTATPAAAPTITFDDVVPEADSPEASSESMGACFSMYSRNRNQTENTCLPEWYPADQSPRAGDRYWCATNGGNIEWVPVRLFDNRSNQTVIPFGGCS